MSKDLIVQTSLAVPDFALVAGTLKVSPETRKTYKYAMVSFKTFCEKRGIAPDLDSLVSWIDSIDNASTQATYIASVKKVLGEVFKYDPRLPDLRSSLEELRPVKKDQAISESGYLKKSEVDDIIKQCSPKIGVVIECLFWTGVRISELLNIKHKNCQIMQDGKIVEIKVIGKRRKENTVYITVKLFKKVAKTFNENVNKSFDGDLYLFNHSGKPYRREYISDEIRKAGLLIGRDISAHTLRHSKAMYMLNDRKISVDKIQKALNHSSASTTMAFYLHGKATPEEMGIK